MNDIRRLRIALEALAKIDTLKIADVTDGSGPTDSSPREKGMLRYIGQVSIIAKDALAATAQNRKV